MIMNKEDLEYFLKRIHLNISENMSRLERIKRRKIRNNLIFCEKSVMYLNLELSETGCVTCEIRVFLSFLEKWLELEFYSFKKILSLNKNPDKKCIFHIV